MADVTLLSVHAHDLSFNCLCADTRPSNGGHVYYRRTTDRGELTSIKSTVFTTNTLPGFTPVEAVVATWDAVGYYE
jgi:hypothetical protein